MLKLAVLCSFLVAAETTLCQNGCRKLTSCIMSGNGQTDCPDAMGDHMNSCNVIATNCSSGEACYNRDYSVTADLMGTRLQMEYNEEKCIAKGKKMTNSSCETWDDLEQTMIASGFSNLEMNCGTFKLVNALNSAAEFGFSALLVTAMYILYNY